jgi:hypothetical protein
MNIGLEYIQPVETIKEKHSHIICKQCNKPLIKPVFCENCCEFICQLCLTNGTCCEFSKVIYLTDTNNESINGKGSIAKLLEQLEIYCPINKICGCDWIGVRRDYFDHCNKCDKKYQLCKFGCGTKFNIDNIGHYDICDFANKWFDITKSDRNDDLNRMTYKNRFTCGKNKLLEESNIKLKNQNEQLQITIKNLEVENSNNMLMGKNDAKKINELSNDNLDLHNIIDNYKKELETMIHNLDMSNEKLYALNKISNGITIIKSINWDIIKPIGNYELITQSQTYIPKQSGYMLIIAVGGGDGGETGCYDTRGGNSGSVEACVIHINNSTPLIIKIGKGGVGGKGTDHNKAYNGLYHKRESDHGIHYQDVASHCNDSLKFTKSEYGQSTKVIFTNGVSLNTIDSVNYAHGGAIDNNGHTINCGLINKISQIYPNIKSGNAGICGEQRYRPRPYSMGPQTYFPRSGGGAGGIIILYDNTKADDGSSPADKNCLWHGSPYNICTNGLGGHGFGAGGAGGAYVFSSLPDNGQASSYTRYYCYDGGNGADGCVIISYIDYDI